MKKKEKKTLKKTRKSRENTIHHWLLLHLLAAPIRLKLDIKYIRNTPVPAVTRSDSDTSIEEASAKLSVAREE